jgi:hypothetical protein
VKDFADERKELLSYGRRSGGEGRDEAFSENNFLLLRNGRDLGEVLVKLPRPGDLIFEVYDS